MENQIFKLNGGMEVEHLIGAKIVKPWLTCFYSGRFMMP